MSGDDDDVAAYLRELSVVASGRRGGDNSGSDGSRSASLSAVKPKSSRFSRNKGRGTASPPDPVPASPKRASPKPTVSSSASENVSTALQKFMKLDQKYSRKPEPAKRREEEDESSLSLSNRSASLRLPPPATGSRRSSLKSVPAFAPSTTEPPKTEKRVTFESEEASVEEQAPPVRRFSLSMEEIHSIEELETSESEYSRRLPVVEVTRREPEPEPELVVQEVPKPVQPVSIPIGGHVRSLAADLVSPETEARPVFAPPPVPKPLPRPAPQVAVPTKSVQERVRVLRESETQTSIDTEFTPKTPTTSLNLSRFDVRKYLDPDVLTAISGEDPAKTLMKYFTDIHVNMIASNIRRQRSLYQSAVDSLEPDHVYSTFRGCRVKKQRPIL